MKKNGEKMGNEMDVKMKNAQSPNSQRETVFFIVLRNCLMLIILFVMCECPFFCGKGVMKWKAVIV